MEYLIKQYPLETGALEIQYIEEYFGEFPRKKTATEIVSRLRDREFLILMAEAPLRDDPGGPLVSLRRRRQQRPGRHADLRRRRLEGAGRLQHGRHPRHHPRTGFVER